MNDEIERLKIELVRAYRALHGYANAAKNDKPLGKAAQAYHSPAVGAAARFVREGSLEGSEYFIGKPVERLHAYL